MCLDTMEILINHVIENLLILNTTQEKIEKKNNNFLPSEEDDKLHWVWLRWTSKIFNTDTHDHDNRYWCTQCWCVSYTSKAKLYLYFLLYMNHDHEAVRAVLPEKYK